MWFQAGRVLLSCLGDGADELVHCGMLRQAQVWGKQPILGPNLDFVATLLILDLTSSLG